MKLVKMIKGKKFWIAMLLLATIVTGKAFRANPMLYPSSFVPADTVVTAQPEIEDEDLVPDSLLKTRWKVQPTQPLNAKDLNRNATDLVMPDNLQPITTYNDTINRYVIGTKMGGSYLSAPLMMTPEEYGKWTEKQLIRNFFRKKNDEIFTAQGKEKFDFSDMHFELGPAEKIFGPGGVRIKTQGTAEIKFGATMKNIDNPSLPVRNRKTTTIDFDEKINMSMSGKVGDKMNMNLNYNTDATFDFDQQNLKLKYDGKEDEIIKLVEAGNVSLPGNSSLVRGASQLFGLRTDLQFGRLKLQTVVSQKKASSVSVSSKGGVQTTSYEKKVTDYEENRHFFLSHYFRERYAAGMKTLPNLATGITINRVEIWITNKTGTTNNTRNIIALADLGENKRVSNPVWTATGQVPANTANSLYNALATQFADARNIDQSSAVLEGMAGMVGGTDFEKLQNARLLNSSEYTLNTALGYVSLKSTLNTDQVLAVAYEYTYGGVSYQVGEFASDITDTSKALFVKSLKNTSNNPLQPNWDLMMKNVYYLGTSSIKKDKFRLDVKFQSDTAGVYLTYIPEAQVKDQPLIRLMGADRLDNNNNVHSNGYFDFVEGYTVSNGRVFFPSPEPFGNNMAEALMARGLSAEKAKTYAFTELYDSTKTVAKQIAEKDKYLIIGQYSGSSANVISIGNGTNIPQGSVVVTAGGVTLQEGSDYTVDYYAGEVTILNQSIIDAGTNINVSCENNTFEPMIRKTMVGMNWEYDFSKDFQLSGTIQHLSEQSLTTKVAMGSEPLNNTLWGLNINWKKESQWLTNILDLLPGLHLTQPSHISFTGEFAHLMAGNNHGTQDNASYIDDFENTKNATDLSTPTSWVLASVPTMFPEYSDKSTLRSGYNRSLLSWYTIDPLFTRRSSSLTPSHIKGDLNQLSNYYVREVYAKELYPNRDQSSYNGATSTIPVLNLAYYPNERGPYNFSTDLAADGTLNNPQNHWGGMMRKLDTSDFEASNIEYVEFWMLDPFIYTRQEGVEADYGGDLYFNLGEVSEDVLHDGKKFYESGLPVDGSQSFSYTQWGKIPEQATTTYAFATSSGTRQQQDLGLNGLNDQEEQNFESYQNFLAAVRGTVTSAALDSIMADPAGDNYHYFRGSDLDEIQASILRRYKYINNPQGNSPDNNVRTEGYDTSYKTAPDVEDINQDFTLNEYEKYYQYRVSIRPEDLEVGRNFIVDKRVTTPKLRNGDKGEATWYQFRIPIRDYEKRVGGISDFSSIRFMRMFLTQFRHPIVLRFASLDLVRGEWRVYEQSLDNSSAGSGRMTVSAVNIEENNDKEPVNYVLPPGIKREQDPTQPQLVENNEQAMAMTFTELGHGESKAVYKNTNLDLRQYKHLQMFVHANALAPNATNLKDDQLALFVRLGSDYKNNYYEYEIPLKLTPAKSDYNRFSRADCEAVWPKDNMLDVDLSVFTRLKRERNKARAMGTATYNKSFETFDDNHPANRISIVGNPSLGEVKTMIIGVRNKSADAKSGEVWVNEMRLMDYNNKGGWAAQGNLNVQLSDLGTLNLQGRYISDGFGGLEEGVAQRSTDTEKNYSFTTSLDLGKFFPDKAKVSAPLYYSVSKEENRPRYNPFDTDMDLEDALSAMDSHERDSLESIAVTKTTNRNFSLSNVRVGIQNKRHPTPVDPANFSFSYSHSHKETTGETTVYEREDNWRGSFNYSWTPVFKPLEPFKGIKSKSKWYDILKKFGLNWLPQNVTFDTEMTRSYYELQERDLEDLGGSQLPVTFNSQFLWNREFAIKWDLTRNLHMNFNSSTHAEVEEPYTPVNKDLYVDHYEAWKDSVWTSVKHFGRPLNYSQSFQASYQLPLNLLPIFDWLTSNATYNATYNWVRGTDLEDGTSLGNTIASRRDFSLNGTFNMEKLYNQVPFLKKVNDRFNKTNNRKKPEPGKSGASKDKNATAAKALPKNQKSFEKEITLNPDTTLLVTHGKKTKRFVLLGKMDDGKQVELKYKKIDDNRIRILNKVDTMTRLKLTLTPKEPLESKAWYRTTQTVTRLLMSVRNVSFTYRNTYSLSLPGFMPSVGNAFGQRNVGAMAPGLDFAFGMAGDGYIEKARENGWLLMNDSVATPATSSLNEDLQLRATLEPFKNLKIDFTASRNYTHSQSVQYMYKGSPTTHSGTFTMTTLSLNSAFEGSGNANNGYHSKTFDRFCRSLPEFRDRVEAQYAGATYPANAGELAGKPFDAANGGVDPYSSDVLIPAFLASYTSMGGKSLDVFPSLSRLLPNWSLAFSGLQRIPWFAKRFKSITLNHAYKSIYAVGSYSSYSTWQEYMNGLGFVTNATTGMPVPGSRYNISTVSINEAFSPLLGVKMTFLNGLTTNLEYRSTRVLNLSTTSVQINETTSRDWVVGCSYKLSNFDPFAPKNHRQVKSASNKKKEGDTDNKKSKTSTPSRSSKGVNRDLNLRLDLSYRQQAAITRDIVSMTSSASSGNTAFKLSFSADYTLSRLITMSFYYDRQINTPLLASNAYPTTTQDFGLNLKISLTR